jgi:two-component system chemotaxis response regulator CheY
MAGYLLVVDDDPDVVHTLTDILHEAGHEAAGATSFEEGKRLLAGETKPSVLITDVRLGMFNGLQLALFRPASTAVIVISGYRDAVIEDETRRLGGVYLLKPIPGPLLLETVEGLLAAQQPGLA